MSEFKSRKLAGILDWKCCSDCKFNISVGYIMGDDDCSKEIIAHDLTFDKYSEAFYCEKWKKVKDKKYKVIIHL